MQRHEILPSSKRSTRVRGTLVGLFALASLSAACRPSVPELQRRLTDPDAETRRGAAAGLAERGAEAAVAVDALVAALEKDPEWSVKERAAWALAALARDGVREVRRALPALVRALRAKAEVSTYAAFALHFLGEEALKKARAELVQAVQGGLQGLPAWVAAVALAKAGPEAKAAVPGLVRTYLAVDSTGALAAGYALFRIAPEDEGTVAAIAKALEGKASPTAQRVAADFVRRGGRPGAAAVPLLTKMLRSTSLPHVQIEAALALRALAPSLREPEPPFDDPAQAGTAKLGVDPRRPSTLDSRLGDPAWKLSLTDPSVLDPLAFTDPKVCAAAGPAAAIDAIRLPRSSDELAPEAQAWVHPLDFPGLLDGISSKDAKVRRCASWALGQVQGFSTQAVELLLVPRLRDPDPRVQIEVIDNLQRLGDPSIIPALEPLKKAGDPGVRKAAEDAIYKLTPRNQSRGGFLPV